MENIFNQYENVYLSILRKTDGLVSYLLALSDRAPVCPLFNKTESHRLLARAGAPVTLPLAPE